MSGRLATFLLSAVALAVATAGAAASAANPSEGPGDLPLGVRIVAPSGEDPLFGPVPVSFEVLGGGARLDLEATVRLDGREVGVLAAPPWRLQVDFGDDNREHRLEVTVLDAGGREAFDRVDVPAIRVDEEYTVALRQLYVTVEDSRGSRRLGLGEEAFRVFDEGRRQELVTFAGGDLALAAAVVLDCSASMEGARIEAALAGAREFLAGMRPQDEAAVLLFGDRVLDWVPFTAPGEDRVRALETVRPEGNTALNDALFLALRRVDHRLGRRVVVLLSDGADVHSALPMSDVLWAARRSQAMVYWIRLRDQGREETGAFRTVWRGVEQNQAQVQDLERLVRGSGGRVLPADTPEELGPAFAEILAELREQYVLGYYPTDLRRDGSWHPIEVRVQGPYRVRTREGYIDY